MPRCVSQQVLAVWTTVPTPMMVVFMLELLMGGCYLSGAYVYATAVPEKWKPGAFDVMFSSHNIFHILVVAGAYVHWRAALVLLAWRDHHAVRTQSAVVCITRHRVSIAHTLTPFLFLESTSAMRI